MGRFITAAALAAMAVGAAGCAQNNPNIAPYYNASLYSRNQPIVQRTDYVFDLGTGGGGGVPASELDRLAAWFDTLNLGYGDRVSLDEASYYADPAVHADVGRVAQSYGLLLSQGAPITSGAVQPGSARVVVSRTSASVPNCPNWAYTGQIGAPISTTPGYGCAINSNLAAMVADPADLVLGQAGDAATDPALSWKAIDAYRRRVPTGYSGEVKAESAGGK